MSKRAEELAARYFSDKGGLCQCASLAALLVQYGQEVREAAAKAADSTEDVVLAVEAIREMPIP